MSLDGFVAGADGCPTWDALPTFQPVTHGYGEVIAQCEAVVMGRTSFDQGYKDWKKDWLERHALRLERHRPFPDGALEPVYALA